MTKSNTEQCFELSPCFVEAQKRGFVFTDDVEDISSETQKNDDNGNVVDLVEWEEQIREDERAKVLDKVAEKIKNSLIDNLDIENATKYGNKNAKQQRNSYATVMKYEIADCVDDLLDDLAEMKGNN